MNTVDLGTYHVRVELEGILGFIYEWGTGARFVPGGYGADTHCIGDVKRQRRLEVHDECKG